MVVFQDGQVGTTQETAGDMSAWSDAGGVLVNGDRPHHGTKNFYIVEGNPGETQANVDFGAGGVFDSPHYRLYVNFSAFGATVGGVAGLMGLRDSVGNFTVECHLHETGGKIYFAEYDPADGVDHNLVEVLLNTWYSVEISYLRANPGGPFVWINGILQYDGGKNITWNKNRFIYLGGYNNLSFTAYADCVVADTAYIGLEAGTTVIRRPLLNVGL